MEAKTVKEVGLILRQSPVPTQNEILERFASLFGKMTVPLLPVLNPIAEEMEKMFFEMTRPVDINSHQRKTIIYYQYYVNSPTVTLKNGYQCSCGYSGIKTDNLFCPNCARKIEWRTPIGKYGKHMVYRTSVKEKR